MSTIAFKNGIMAAETLCSTGGIRSYASKIRRIRFCNKPNSSVYRIVLFGVAGDITIFPFFIKWYETTKVKIDRLVKDRPERLEKADVNFLVYDTGVLYFFCETGCSVVNEPWAAIGSGQSLAIGAMEMGASAKRAVEVACKWDMYSGGEIETIKV